jgi:hypothetical protein
VIYGTKTAYQRRWGRASPKWARSAARARIYSGPKAGYSGCPSSDREASPWLQPFQVSFAWERGGIMADKPEPLVFEVTP